MPIAGQPDRQVGAAPVAVEDDPQRQQRMRHPAFRQREQRPAGPPRRPAGPMVSGAPQLVVSASENP